MNDNFDDDDDDESTSENTTTAVIKRNTLTKDDKKLFEDESDNTEENLQTDDDDDDDDNSSVKKHSDSGDDNDSDEDDDDDHDFDNDDIYTIKPKLAKYYEKQFKSMQNDLNGVICGSIAKSFFEKSKLPLNELSRIWELSDVNRDGALSFSEFSTAMHLVVLRVRNFDLPEQLPAKLHPYTPLIDTPLIDFETGLFLFEGFCNCNNFFFFFF
jgi:hypothetical protein